jgi:hypothetical protein
MTPFESANLSLNDLELPLPTVGGSPLTSGGQVTAFSEGAVLSEGGPPGDCATASPPRAIDTAIIKTLERMSNPHELTKEPPSGNASPAGVFRSNVPPCRSKAVLQDRDHCALLVPRIERSGTAFSNAVPFLPAATPKS